MFSFATASWPSVITVRQPGHEGVMRPVQHLLDEVREHDNGHECDYCASRTLVSAVYRDQFGLRVWHPDCFMSELATRRLAGTWRLQSMEWSTRS